MLKRLRFKGGFFTKETVFELFDEEERISLVYGKNGSGKSTISKAIKKAKGENEDEIEFATLRDDEDKELIDVEHVHVFNEDYINSRVRIRENGLKSIVLLGELGDLEDKILDLELQQEAESDRNLMLKKVANDYKESKNKKSPSNCRLQINIGLSGDNHWAGREKIINDLKRNASVTEKVIDAIIKLTPSESLPVLKERYDRNLELLEKIRRNEASPIRSTEMLNISFDEEALKTLLSQKVERPVLSDRETYLLQLVNDEKMDQINEMRKVFSIESTRRCPFCFQDISEDVKHSLICSIEKILSKEVDVHVEKLRGCLIKEVSVDFSGIDVINSENCSKCKKAVDRINDEIFKICEIVRKKIFHPYTPIIDFESNLGSYLNEYETVRRELQKEIDAYNDAVNKVARLKRLLADDSAAIARYEVDRDIELWREAIEAQDKADSDLKKSDEKLNGFQDELNILRARKKNIKIAVNLINKSLRYVFFSNERLEIRVEADKYVLYTHGNPVRPNNVSVGERNIIALCYFFTELIENQEAKDGYSKPVVLAIDDPVSSFDFENKVGIMSFLKSKLLDIVVQNPKSQVLIMTHDIQCLYDLQKIADEISEDCKVTYGQKKRIYSCRELKDKGLISFNYKKRNEYSELLKIVYDYANGEFEGGEYIVGNAMRRVLEAFSTFVYKKGISEVSCDELILQTISDKDYIEYFKNLMYRLVLNGDSHMEERTVGLEDVDYVDFLSDKERQRTAREVICFIYLLNNRHVLAHLEGKKDVQNNINKWCCDIKRICSSDASL